MKPGESRVAAGDYAAALHMNVSAARQPVKTQAVGYIAHASPTLAISLPLRAVGQHRLPASLFTAYDGLHLHPALVAAAAHATCQLAAAKIDVAAPGSDEGAFALLAKGKRALGAPHAHWTEMALHRLAWMADVARRVVGGTRVHGLVRWVANPGASLLQTPAGEPDSRALIHHLVLAFSSPPISTLRRAPSLEYYRAEGVMMLRLFGDFTVDASEGR